VTDTVFYLASSFWLGAVHAATPGHGKTISAAYIVGARGRPVDALVLGIFVTLSHTSGIILVGVLATMGSAWLVPQRVEAYLGVVTGLLVIAIGLWMLRTQLSLSSAADHTHDHDYAHEHAHDQDHAHEHGVEHAHDHDGHTHAHGHGHDHVHGSGHAGAHADAGYHSHGWGRRHSHGVAFDAVDRPRLPILLGLGIAGGLLPDPGALAILLAALASGKLVLGLLTVLVFSIGFASVLVVVGVVAARVGAAVLTWLSGRWVGWLQIGAALLIVAVGLGLTVNAWRSIIALQ
jgi:nickel/cobalt exporter